MIRISQIKWEGGLWVIILDDGQEVVGHNLTKTRALAYRIIEAER